MSQLPLQDQSKSLDVCMTLLWFWVVRSLLDFLSTWMTGLSDRSNPGVSHISFVSSNPAPLLHSLCFLHCTMKKIQGEYSFAAGIFTNWLTHLDLWLTHLDLMIHTCNTHCNYVPCMLSWVHSSLPLDCSRNMELMQGGTSVPWNQNFLAPVPLKQTLSGPNQQVFLPFFCCPWCVWYHCGRVDGLHYLQ